MENEVWKPIPSIYGAAASSCGRVWMPSKKGVQVGNRPNAKRDYISRPTFGYEEKGGTARQNSRNRRILRWSGKTYKIHQLVCEAFHGPKPTPAHIVLHLNEDAGDNRPENLRWGTRKENQNFPEVKKAFKARVGEKSPVNNYMARGKNDPSYKPRSRKGE